MYFAPENLATVLATSNKDSMKQNVNFGPKVPNLPYLHNEVAVEGPFESRVPSLSLRAQALERIDRYFQLLSRKLKLG